MKLLTKVLWSLPFSLHLLYAQQNSSAQDSLQGTIITKQLDEVVVIDSRFPVKSSQSGKPVIKINPELLQNSQGLGISEVLKQFAGIEVLGSQTYAGQNKTVSIRGGRNRQVLIMIDGVRVSDPSRIDNDFNINFLDLSQIESIEILKGASSTLYGNSAATGVINIKTKTIDSGFHASLQSSVGSQNSQDTKRDLNLFKNSLHLSHGGEKIRAKAYVAQHNASGMSAVVGTEMDPFTHLNLGTSLEYKIKTKFDVKAGYDHSNIESDYDNTFPLEDADFKLYTQMDRLYLNPNYNYKDGGLSLRLGFQKINREFQSDFPFQTVSENIQAELFNKYVFNDRMYTVIGTLIQKNSADYQGGKQTNQNDFFGNVVMKFTDQVRVNFGTRWNIHSNYGSHFTYSINPSMQTFETDKSSLKFQAAYSTAFIAPSLYQLFDPYSGNIDLKPEENSSFEIGLVYKLNEWNLSSTYFNRIESPTLIYDLATYRYENANDKARYFGAEVTLSGSVGANFSLDHQMTFTETRDGDLRYLPNFSSQTRLSYLFSKTWNVSLSTQIIGSRFGLDNTTVLDAYQLINFSVVHQLDTIPLQLFVHGTNLFNEDYIEIEGYATRGRNLVAGFRYLFR